MDISQGLTNPEIRDVGKALISHIYTLLQLLCLFVCNLQLAQMVHESTNIFESRYLKSANLKNAHKIQDPCNWNF